MFSDEYNDSPPPKITEKPKLKELVEEKPPPSFQAGEKRVFILYFAFDSKNNLKLDEDISHIKKIIQQSNYRGTVEFLSNQDARYSTPEYCEKGQGSFQQLIKICDDLIKNEEEGVFWLLHLSCRGNLNTIEFRDGYIPYDALVVELLGSLKKAKSIKKIPGIFLSVCSSDCGADKLSLASDFSIGATRNISPDFTIDCTKIFYKELMSGYKNFAQAIQVANSDVRRALVRKEDEVVSQGSHSLPFMVISDGIDPNADLYHLSKFSVSAHVKQLDLRVQLKRHFERFEYEKIYRNDKNLAPLRVDACNLSFGKEQNIDTEGGVGIYGIKKITWRKKGTHRVLITGCAKSGKTSLCKRLMYDWEEKGSWRNNFDLLLWFPLNHLKRINVAKRTGKITDFLSELFFLGHPRGEELAQQLYEKIDENPLKVLFIIDEFDEVSDLKDEVNIQGFMDFLLNHPRTLCVSPPQNEILEAVSFQDRFEIFGFKQEDINHYLDSVFKEEDRIKTKIKRFIEKRLKKSRIGEYNLWNDILRIPGYLDMICEEWDSLTGEHASRFVIEFNFYQACIRMLWRGVSRQVEMADKIRGETEPFLKQVAFAYLPERKLDLSKIPQYILKNIFRCGFLVEAQQGRYFLLLMLGKVYTAEHIAELIEENKNAVASSLLFSEKGEQRERVWAWVAHCLRQKKNVFSQLYNLLPKDFEAMPEVPIRVYGSPEVSEIQDDSFGSFSESSGSDSDFESALAKIASKKIDVSDFTLRLQCLEVSQCRFIGTATRLAIYNKLRALVDFLYSGGAIERSGQRLFVSRSEGLAHLIKYCPFIVKDSKLIEYVLSKEEAFGVTAVGVSLLESFSGCSDSIVEFIKGRITKNSFRNDAAKCIRAVKLLLSCNSTAINQEIINQLLLLLSIEDDGLQTAVVKVLKKFRRLVDNDKSVDRLLVLLRGTKLAVELKNAKVQPLVLERSKGEETVELFSSDGEEEEVDSDKTESEEWRREVYPFDRRSFTLRAVVDVLKHLQTTMSKEKRLDELVDIMKSTEDRYVRARLLYLLKFLTKKNNSAYLLNYLCSHVVSIPIKNNDKITTEFKNLLAVYEMLLRNPFSRERDDFLLILMKKMRVEDFSSPGLVQVVWLLPLRGMLVTERGFSPLPSTVSGSPDASDFEWEDLIFFLEHSNKYMRMCGLLFVQKVSIESMEIFHSYIESFSHVDHEVQLTFVETFLEFVPKEKKVLMVLAALTQEVHDWSVERLSEVIAQLAEIKLVLTDPEVFSSFARMFECRWSSVQAAVIYSFKELLKRCDNKTEIMNGLENIINEETDIPVPIDGVIEIYRIMRLSINTELLDDFIARISTFKSERVTANLSSVFKTFNVSLERAQIVELIRIIKAIPQEYDASIKADLIAVIFPLISNVSDLVLEWLQFLYDTLKSTSEANVVRQSAARSIKYILGRLGHSALGKAIIKNIFHRFIDIINDPSESLRLRIIAIKALKNFSEGEYQIGAIRYLTTALSGRYTFLDRNILHTLFKLISSDKVVEYSEDDVNQILIRCGKAQVSDFKSRYYLVQLLKVLRPFPHNNTSLFVLLKLIFRAFTESSHKKEGSVGRDNTDGMERFNDSYPDLAHSEIKEILRMTLDFIFTQFEKYGNVRRVIVCREYTPFVPYSSREENEKILREACRANGKNPYQNVNVLIAILELAKSEYYFEDTSGLGLDENLQALRDSNAVGAGYGYKTLFLVTGGVALAGFAWYSFFRQSSSDNGDSLHQLSSTITPKK